MSVAGRHSRRAGSRWRRETPRDGCRRPVVASLALAALVCAQAELARSDDADERVRLEVFQVWGSPEPAKDKPDAALADYLEKLRKSSGLRSFRLAGKPRTMELATGGEVAVDLPHGYRASWRLVGRGKEPKLEQTLVNPRAMRSVVTVGKSPAITTLAKIRENDETFLLLVTFRRR